MHENLFQPAPGPGPSDLEAEVCRHLHGQVNSFRLEAGVHGLILHGWARNHHAKQLALHAVMRRTAVPIEANRIGVVSETRKGSAEPQRLPGVQSVTNLRRADRIESSSKEREADDGRHAHDSL